MLWVERALAVLGAARDVSWTFACPAHCGSSFLVPLLLGVCLGLIFGFLSFLLLLAWLRPDLLGLVPRHIPHPAQGEHPSFALRRRSRLSGYLHE